MRWSRAEPRGGRGSRGGAEEGRREEKEREVEREWRMRERCFGGGEKGEKGGKNWELNIWKWSDIYKGLYGEGKGGGEEEEVR